MAAPSSLVGDALVKCFNEDGDCTIAVVEGTNGGDGSAPRKQRRVEFRVWSKLLGAWSDVFAAMFTHNFKEKSEMRIEINDFTAPAVGAFLRFFYCSNLQADPAVLIEVSALADKYVVAPLQDICAKKMDETLTPETACEMLEVTERLGASTLKDRCLDSIFKNSQKALANGFVLGPSLLEEVLGSEMLCIDDFALSKLILDWSQSPIAKARGVNIGSLMNKHVHIAALDEEQCGKLQSLADHVGHGKLVADMRSHHKRGRSTTDLFETLWSLYRVQFPDTQTNSPPFLGYWVNLIPSQVSFGSTVTSNGFNLLNLQALARNGVDMKLGANDSMSWMIPHHEIYVSGVSFKNALHKDCKLEVFASDDGSAWHNLINSDMHKALYSSSGAVIRCSSKGRVKWFKLYVHAGHYDGRLRFHGIILVK